MASPFKTRRIGKTYAERTNAGGLPTALKLARNTIYTSAHTDTYSGNVLMKSLQRFPSTYMPHLFVYRIRIKPPRNRTYMYYVRFCFLRNDIKLVLKDILTG